MSDWAALRERIGRDYFVIKKDHDRLLLACLVPYGRWYVRVQCPSAGASELEVAVIVRGKLDLANQYVILREKLPVAGIAYAELRRTIEALTAQAARVALAVQPDEAIFALYGRVVG